MIFFIIIYFTGLTLVLFRESVISFVLGKSFRLNR